MAKQCKDCACPIPNDRARCSPCLLKRLRSKRRLRDKLAAVDREPLLVDSEWIADTLEP